jgi:hypothetical protein
VDPQLALVTKYATLEKHKDCEEWKEWRGEGRRRKPVVWECIDNFVREEKGRVKPDDWVILIM